MDLMKIGRYIAGKRRALDMTQRELAEKLGMSDKSVSKWERGVCIPDVSLYSELCGILGISLNEFLSGEDIPKETMIQKAEETILGVMTEGKSELSRSKIIICILLALTIVFLSVLSVMLFQSHRPQNYIYPVDRDSIEAKTANMLSGSDTAYLYKYITTDKYLSLKLFVSEYRSGELVDKQEVVGLGYEEIGSPGTGTIAIAPDFKALMIKIIVADDSTTISTEIPMLEGVLDLQSFGRSFTQIKERTPITYSKEQRLIGLIYGKDEIQVTNLHSLLENNKDGFHNDYVYVFTVEFYK